MSYPSNCLILTGAAILLSCTAVNPEYDPTSGHKRIFLTFNQYRGGDPSSSDRPGQLICDQAATSVGLFGKWTPWLSYHIVYPVNAIDEIHDVGPWYDLKGTLIFPDKASMLGAPAAPLRVTEQLTEVALDDAVWTGTRRDGSRSDNLCLSQLPYRVWYSEANDHTGDIGMVGRLDGSWTQAGSLVCNKTAHIICIEQ